MEGDVSAQPGFDWSFLDGIYCISLQSRDDRTASAAAQFHRLGLCRRVVFYRPLKHPTRTVIGIWESHRAVAVRALAHEQGTVLILEDDVLFGERVRPRTIGAIAGALRGLPPDWMIFYLGHMARWAYFVRPRVLRVSSTAAHAYIASPRLFRGSGTTRSARPASPMSGLPATASTPRTRGYLPPTPSFRWSPPRAAARAISGSVEARGPSAGNCGICSRAADIGSESSRTCSGPTSI